jgi:hypothetical protein
MNAFSKNLKQWWLPALILMLAILLVSLLLPNLIYPSNVQRGGLQEPIFTTATATSTLPPTSVDNFSTPATSNVSLETQATPTLEVRSGQNCTYTQYYWRSNPNAWLAENILIGRFSYSKSEAIEILNTENQEVTTDLLKQFFSTLLNSLKGADTSSVDSTLVQASDWLGRHALGFEVSQDDRQTGAALAQTLQDYNNGVTGPGPCSDEPATPTPLPTETPTPTQTPTPTRIPIRLPATATPEPTEERERPTEEPTSQPTEAATEPPPTEEPTETEPPPPTEVPEPTDTPEPRETPTPAPPAP